MANPNQVSVTCILMAFVTEVIVACHGDIRKIDPTDTYMISDMHPGVCWGHQGGTNMIL